MKLKNYLEKNNIPAYKLAADCGISPSLIYSLLQNKRDIYLSIAMKISRATKGAVGLDEIIEDSILEKKITRTKKKAPTVDLKAVKRKKSPKEKDKKHGYLNK